MSSVHFRRQNGNILHLPSSRAYPGEGRGGSCPPDEQIFLKKDQFLKKIGIFGQKNRILPLPEFFFILPPSKISPGYALGCLSTLLIPYGDKTLYSVFQRWSTHLSIRYLHLSYVQIFCSLIGSVTRAIMSRYSYHFRI